jgi:hypothetical protein
LAFFFSFLEKFGIFGNLLLGQQVTQHDVDVLCTHCAMNEMKALATCHHAGNSVNYCSGEKMVIAAAGLSGKSPPDSSFQLLELSLHKLKYTGIWMDMG